MAEILEKPVDILITISKILQELMIDFCVSGGYAVCIWGQPRFTADIDIVINLEEKRISELADKLKSELPDAYIDEHQMRQAFGSVGEFNVIEPTIGIKVDFFILNNVEYDKLILRRSVKKDVGKLVNFISPEDLIISKLRWYKMDQSSRHLEDIRSIMRLNKIDHQYLDEWVGKFKLKTELERVEDGK